MDEAESIWRAIKARNDWQLVVDDAAFVRAAMEVAAADADTSAIEQSLLHAYRWRLYAALLRGDERAATELRQTCYGRARAQGLDEGDAADAAQETIRRVLERLADVRAPEAIVAYALLVQRSMLRDRARRHSASSLEAGMASSTISEPVEPYDVAQTVESRVAAEQLVRLVERVLAHPMERLVVQRVVIEGEKPRDVARDLALPLHRVRVHKSRALGRLRADPVFMYACRQLMIDFEAASAKEQSDDLD